MPSTDCSAQRPARNGITPADLTVGRMTLSELFHGRFRAETRQFYRTEKLLAEVVGSPVSPFYNPGPPISAYDIPDEVVYAVTGVCDRSTCCENGREPGASCDNVGACGCKVVRHAAHTDVVQRPADAALARQHAIEFLEAAR